MEYTRPDRSHDEPWGMLLIMIVGALCVFGGFMYIVLELPEMIRSYQQIQANR